MRPTREWMRAQAYAHGTMRLTTHLSRNFMATKSDWAPKVLAIIKSGNSAAAILQIKVAPTVKDVKALRLLMAGANMLAKHPDIDRCTLDAIDNLSGPRLHRSPPGR